MAPTPSIVVYTSMPYQGGDRIYGNRYHFNGGLPADSGAWGNLRDALCDSQRSITPATSTIIGVKGYNASQFSVFEDMSLSLIGEFDVSTKWLQAGATAVVVKYLTPARTKKNHPIYLFNYYHPGIGASDHDGDTLDTDYAAAFATFAEAWVSPGFSDGSTLYTRAGPNGVSVETYQVEEYVSHRDFPR